MARQKTVSKIRSYGVYTPWEEASKKLPKLVEATTDIPARENIEFGFIVNIKSSKNQKVTYIIEHPGITGDSGLSLPPFTGDVYIDSNDWDFYLGDSIWLPLNDKLGHWKMTLKMDNIVLAEKTFLIDIELKGERTLGAARSSFKPKKRW